MRLDLKAKSNVDNIIRIPSYSIDQTFDIIKERAGQALEKYIYSEDALKKIAQLTQGNMALSLVLLKLQALRAESRDKKSLDDIEITCSFNNPNDKLSQNERVLLTILHEWRSLSSSRLVKFYNENTKHPKNE